MLATPKDRRQLIFRYQNSGDVPMAFISTGKSMGWMALCLNDLYRPTRFSWDGTTLAPPSIPAKVEWSAFYAFWKVNMVEIIFSITNLAQGRSFYIGWLGMDQQYGVLANPEENWSSTMRMAKTNRWCKIKQTGNNWKGSPTTISAKIPIAKYTGNQFYRTEERFAGGSSESFNTSPSEEVPLYLFIMNEDGNNEIADLSFPMQLTINMYCTLYGKDLEKEFDLTRMI